MQSFVQVHAGVGSFTSSVLETACMSSISDSIEVDATESAIGELCVKG